MLQKLLPHSSDRKPRLLMLTHRFPFPPDRGDRIRSYNTLRFLTEEFSVTLASVANEPVQSNHLQHVQSMCEDVLIGRRSRATRLRGVVDALCRSKSLTEGMLHSRQLACRVTQLQKTQAFDAVFVFCSSMFPYVDQEAFRDVTMLVDLVDVDSQKWKQMSKESGLLKGYVLGREMRLVRQLEQRIAQRADAITLVSDEEALLYSKTIDVPQSATVQGVGNGVDAGYFAPAASFESPFDSQHEGLNLVFTGVLNYYPNVAGVDWFCRQVLPLVQKRLNVSFKIVGRSPNAKVRSLANVPGVELVGSVPDVRPYLACADVVVSPLKLARGIQNKVLEAMAMQRPVICTSPSAEGISGEHGTHFLIADTVEQWCDELIRLNEDASLRRKIAAAARKRVVEEYSWTARLQPFVELLRPSKNEADSRMELAHA